MFPLAMTPGRRFSFAFSFLSSLFAIGACSCASNDQSAGDGPKGCSKAPDCDRCEACFDKCVCAGTDAQGCLVQCGGGGAGGSGGAAGAPAGGGAPGGGGGGNCSTFTNEPQCDGCLAASCCSQVAACNANPSCTGLLACLSQNCINNPNFNQCAQDYCGEYAGGVNDYNAVGQCAQASCASPCGVSG